MQRTGSCLEDAVLSLPQGVCRVVLEPVSCCIGHSSGQTSALVVGTALTASIVQLWQALLRQHTFFLLGCLNCVACRMEMHCQDQPRYRPTLNHVAICSKYVVAALNVCWTSHCTLTKHHNKQPENHTCLHCDVQVRKHTAEQLYVALLAADPSQPAFASADIDSVLELLAGTAWDGPIAAVRETASQMRSALLAPTV